ncbi:MAG: glycosyltransferase family 39 protein [Chloracidobacterium sp.]|nr:glycosyltransferase family 39 protein [Chloracidobacterium sp.]
MTDKSNTLGTPSARSHQVWWHRGLLLLLLGILAAATWRKWGDPLIDFGCELYVPWQITQGKHLYRDMGWLGGPLAQYGNALAFALFGVSFTTLIWLNLTLLALLTELIRAYFARCVSPAAGLVAGSLLLGLFAFGQYGLIGTYNYIAPYRHEAIRGVLLAIGALQCAASAWALSAEAPKRVRWLIGFSGLLFGGVLLTKLEIALATGLALLVGWGVGLTRLGVQRATARSLFVWFVGGTVLPPVSFILYLACCMPFGVALRGVLGNLVTVLTANPTQQAFYRYVFGLDAWERHLIQMATGCGVVGATLLVVLAAEHWLPHRQRPAAAVGASLLTGWLAHHFGPWAWFAEPFPVLLTLTAVGLGYAVVVEEDNHLTRRQWLPLLMWNLFALALLGRLGLAVQLHHYGFVLTMPAFLLLAVLTLFGLPRLLQQRHIGTGLLVRGVAAGFLVACLAVHLQLTFHFHEKKTQPVGLPGDHLLTYGERWGPVGVTLAEAVTELATTLPPQTTLLVMPEGIALNYWLRRENPTSFLAFDPYYLAAGGGESAVVAELERRPPDFIAITRRDMSEYGVGWFGEDPNYGRRIMSWVARRYEVARVFGDWDTFGVVLLKPREPKHRSAPE